MSEVNLRQGVFYETRHPEEAPGTFHRAAGNVVNPDSSNGGIAARWQTSRPQIAVIDNLLTEQALAGLLRFCWGSTIWQRVYRDGYLGAMPEHGFACPLLAQITEELRATYPAILGQHPRLQFWGFKYDSKLSGIAIHADFAAVNINFWITPDEANLDPSSGGLVIWDVPAPLDWDFAKYNDNAPGSARIIFKPPARDRSPSRTGPIARSSSTLICFTKPTGSYSRMAISTGASISRCSTADATPRRDQTRFRGSRRSTRSVPNDRSPRGDPQCGDRGAGPSRRLCAAGRPRRQGDDQRAAART